MGILSGQSFHLFKKILRIVERADGCIYFCPMEIESSILDLEQPVMFTEVAAFFSEAQLNHYFSLAMMNLGIRPALGNKLWFEVNNPHIDLLNGEESLGLHKAQIGKAVRR